MFTLFFMAYNQDLGARGEQIAARWYQDNGYEVIGRNARYREGEIDLICRKADVLYFIEVKTRRSRAFGFPEEAITPRKLGRMQRCAEKFIRAYRGPAKGYELQVCSIEVCYPRTSIRMYPVL